MTSRRATATNDRALAAFVAAKAEIDARLDGPNYLVGGTEYPGEEIEFVLE